MRILLIGEYSNVHWTLAQGCGQRWRQLEELSTRHRHKPEVNKHLRHPSILETSKKNNQEIQKF